MSTDNKNTDQFFRDSFQNWDAPHSSNDMHKGWEQISTKTTIYTKRPQHAN